MAELKREAQLKRDEKRPLNALGKHPVNGVNEMQDHVARPVMVVTEQPQECRAPGLLPPGTTRGVRVPDPG